MTAVTCATLEEALRQRVGATFVDVVDVSCGCGEKFHVVVVSPQFDGVPLLDRHRLVNEALKEEIKRIHALSLKTWTPAQYEKKIEADLIMMGRSLFFSLSTMYTTDFGVLSSNGTDSSLTHLLDLGTAVGNASTTSLLPFITSVLARHLVHNDFLVGGGIMVLLGYMWILTKGMLWVAWMRLSARFMVRVRVRKNDGLAWQWIQHWLERHPYTRSGRAGNLTAVGRYRNDDSDFDSDLEDDDDDECTSKAASIGSSGVRVQMTPDDGTHVLHYQNHVIYVERRGMRVMDGADFYMQDTEEIVLCARSRQVVTRLLLDAAAQCHRNDAQTQVFSADRGNWELQTNVPIRPVHSVVLPEGVMEGVVQDATEFVTMETRDFCRSLGVPHRRGYLIHGPPGCGKTSLVLALAGHLRRSVFVVHLARKGQDDTDLWHLMRNANPKCILLFEDIDCMFTNRKTNGHGGITFSGLLNVLDGVGSAESRLVVMTTNHPDRLDPALIRPGRVDLRIPLTHATRDQCRRMFNRFFSKCPHCTDAMAITFSEHIPVGKLSMADIQEWLMRHKNDPTTAMEKVCMFVEEVIDRAKNVERLHNEEKTSEDTEDETEQEDHDSPRYGRRGRGRGRGR